MTKLMAVLHNYFVNMPTKSIYSLKEPIFIDLKIVRIKVDYPLEHWFPNYLYALTERYCSLSWTKVLHH